MVALALLASALSSLPLETLPAIAQSGVTADANADDAQARLDRWNGDLTRIDMALDRVNVSDFDLRNLRDETLAIVNAAATYADTLGPKVDAAMAQVKELSPIEGADATVSDAIKDNLAVAQKLLGDLSGSQKQAQAIAAHGAYTVTQLNDRRRRLFTGRLLERNASLIDPSLWKDAAQEFPNVVNRGSDLITGWFSVLQDRNDRTAIAIVLAVIAAMLALIIPGRRFVIRHMRLRPSGPDEQSGREPKVIAAATVVALNTLVPVGVLVGGHAILNALNLSPNRIDQLFWGITSAVALFSLGFGVSRALLAPGRPDLRLVDEDEASATRIFNFTVAVAAMQGMAVFIERFSTIAYTGLPVIIAADGLISTTSAILIILTVRTINHRDPAEEDDEDPATEGPLFRRLALIGASIMAAMAIVANLIGYVSLGRFVTTQIVWISIVISLLVLLMMLIDQLTAAWFRREGIVGSRLIASVGFAPRSLTQVGVLFNGLVRALMVGIAILLIIAPWGVDSTSVFESIRQLFFGFRIGSISISISTIFAGIAVFVVGVVVTRALQSWLDTRFLPTTRLDSGLRNSIRTSVGYIGMITAATIAFGYAGLDLSNIAIVAGALSVGIGLGLQAIVNNFVSGLILLAERPIRAGDWIAVGAEEGVVKRINVRATEIETFDRATLIVPNSSLITGTVKNMVLRDRSGRIIIPVAVAKLSDPEKVRSVLISAAKSHRLVLAYPEPSVLFTAFSAASLEFELRCYLSDISQGAQVRSDLRFDFLARFQAEDIALP
ncbi:Small-conductance mechanosensitive channel [Kaistia soli DSM 19436]|uniref:Small-conductance mechanosensitive channel n=2 Tax=Kaistia TaxID=166953 RepID=A0A1M5C7I3_9HYPH|nr:Small-conductance mechanosensitive channel [Kaistia soli DSM 19436]